MGMSCIVQGYAGNTAACVVAVDACTPLGLDVQLTQAEAALGLGYFAETEMVDRAGEPIRASFLPLISRSSTRTRRMLELGMRAIQQPCAQISRLGIRAVPLLLGCPEPGGGDYQCSELTSALCESVADKVDLYVPSSGVFPLGRASFFAALAAGLRYLDTSAIPAVLIGAVDSLCDAASLARLAGANRVLGRANIDGLIPGEGAGFAALVRAELLPVHQRACKLLCISFVDIEIDVPRRQADLSNQLTKIFASVRSQLGELRTDRLLSCQTSESFWAEEFTRAYLRNAALLPEPLKIELLAASMGDTGAAAGALQFCLAVASPDEQYRRSLVYACSDSGSMGACVVEVAGSRPSAAEQGQVDPISNGPKGQRGSQLLHSESTALYHTRFLYHLNEIGFLLHQRGLQISTGQVTWRSLANTEARVVAHLGVLRAGKGAALECAREALDSDEPEYLLGAAYALASLSSDRGDQSLLLSRYESTDVSLVPLLAGALSQALQNSWVEPWVARLGRQRPEIQPSTLQLLVTLGSAELEILHRMLDSPIEMLREVAASALVSGCHRAALPAVERTLTAYPESAGLLSAAICLGSRLARRLLNDGLVMGRSRAAGHLRLRALLGDRADADFFSQLAAERVLSLEAIEALGWYGLPEFIPSLIGHLRSSEPERCKSAALALQRLTGGDIQERVWIADEQFGDGQSVWQPSRDPERWTHWEEQHRGQFRPRQRYRLGQPFRLALLVSRLDAPDCPHAERSHVWLELMLQSTNLPTLDLTWPVRQQKQVIEQWRAHLTSGAWRDL